jgi:hypothetical protein
LTEAFQPDDELGAPFQEKGAKLPEVPGDVPTPIEPLWHLLLRVFGRTPTRGEIDVWGQKLLDGMDARAFVNQLVRSRRFNEIKYVHSKNPPGHFFSPVVDPDEVRDYVAMARDVEPHDIAGIEFPLEAMAEFWRKNRDFIASTPFTEQPSPANRYCYRGGPYSYGDGITARAMVGHFRPRRVIEIGSGLSSACMLDAAEHAGIEDFHLTCIEPYPARLKSVLRPDDEGTRVTLHERPVQGMPLDMFRALEPNDFLFIDSTHVLKTGSDVHYELFYILPALKPGVLVHFHDCRWPLEYSDIQIFQKNYSWNEVYAVRALLMHSTRYKVFFSGSLFAKHHRKLVAETAPAFLRNPGSALWLMVH